MNLQPINPPEPVFTSACCECHSPVNSQTGYADLDGKAFESYYCPGCADKKTPGLNDYEEKLEQRRQRYLDKADKADKESTRHYEESNKLGRMMQGEPIKVGHHSEGRHRADLNRCHRHMDKMCEEGNKAKHYKQKAAGVGKGGISSDDPEAVVKLKTKLENLQANHEMMKRVNRQFRKGGWDAIEGLSAATISLCKSNMAQYSWIKAPFEAYQLTNSNGRIKQVKDRIASLAQESEFVEQEPVQGDGFTITENLKDNRIWIEFDEKPPKPICQLMRRNGWKWSPSRCAWVRNLNNAGRYSAEQTAKQLEAA